MDAVHKILPPVELGEQNRKVVGAVGLAEHEVAEIYQIPVVFGPGPFKLSFHGLIMAAAGIKSKVPASA
jgi:hypothetical protein